MPKTTSLSLEQIAAPENIEWALQRACRGKRQRTDVQEILCHPEEAILKVSEALLAARLPAGHFDSFVIHDPKKRVIHAAPLLDRIAHHALVRFLEPRLEKALLPSVYACRVGKGVHRAVAYAQKQCRRYPWVMHADIAQYFPSIDHHILRQQLHRRFRGDGTFLIHAVIDAYGADAGKGLPIGALTSQHFANHYLNEIDRWCLQQDGVVAHCRYMDDFLLWANNKEALLSVQSALARRLTQTLSLAMKPALIQRSRVGVLFCGIKIRPFQIRASLRRKRRYRLGVDRLEANWQRGEIDSHELQRGYDAIHSTLLPAYEKTFRQRFFSNRETMDA